MQVCGLINLVVRHLRAALHQRQLDGQRDLGTHRFEHTGPLPQAAAGFDTDGYAFPPAAPESNTLQATPSVQARAIPDEVMALLTRLSEFRDAGVVTSEDFEAEKKEPARPALGRSTLLTSGAGCGVPCGAWPDAQAS